MRKLADVFWSGVPRVGNRLSPTLGVVLTDGNALMTWPVIAATAPIIAFLGGLLAGGFRPAAWETYTFSLVLMGAMVAASLLGAALGFWTWLGWVIGDFLLFDRPLTVRGEEFATLGDRALDQWVPLLISYIMLWGLLVGVPLATAGFRQRAIDGVRPGPARLLVGAAFFVGLAAIFTTMWTFVLPPLIRPLWTFQGFPPPLPAIEPVQVRGWMLTLIASAAAIARVIIEHRAERAGGALKAPPAPTRRPGPVRRAMTAVGQAGLVTLLMSGLLENAGQAVLIGVVVLGFAVARSSVHPRLPRYSQLVNKVPLLIRLAVVGLVGLGFGYVLLGRAFDQGQDTFFPMVLALVLSLVVAAAVLPPEPEVAPDTRTAAS